MAADTGVSEQHLDETFYALLESGDFSDLTITCQGTTFNVHKTIVCFQSRFFRNAVKQGAFKEGETGVVDLPDDDPDAVKAMLQFLYSRAYGRDPDRLALTMPLHARTYCLARKLNLEHLTSYSLWELSVSMQGLPPSPEEWASTVREIYANSADDDTVRELVITGAIRNLDRLLEDKDNAFSAMMLEVGEFGRDVARTARYAPDFKDSVFNPIYDGDKDDNYHPAEMLDFYCSECEIHWRTFKGFTLRDGNKNTLFCPRFACRKTLDAISKQGFPLLRRRDCGDCWENRLWCSSLDDQETPWFCPACSHINNG